MSLRKALLVGINAYEKDRLRGCINDVSQIRSLLERYYSFPPEEIHILLDTDATGTNIKAGLEWLAQGGNTSDAVRVFHYSGHGSYVPDQNGDEPDGRDECLVPYDHRANGMLTDDMLKIVYDRFPQQSNLTLIMDSCHSGTVQKELDEDIVYRFFQISLEAQRLADDVARRFAQEQEDFVVGQLAQLYVQKLSTEEFRQKVHQLIATFQKQRFGDIRVRESNILLAGCRADQQAADARIAGSYHGAFTYYLAEAIEQSQGHITYRQLIQAVGEKLSAARFAQIPQIEFREGRDERLAFQPFT